MSESAVTPRRPGGRMASRPLHFIWLADGSGSMRIDGKIVLITVSRLPSKVDGLMANLERWCGKVGLPKAIDEKNILHLMIDGKKTPYVDLKRPDGAKAEVDRLLGVVAERGPVTWFFKLQGPADQVGEQKTAFEAFVTSVKFGDTGAKDE